MIDEAFPAADKSESGLQEVVRVQAEGVADRLDVLLHTTTTQEAVHEAVRLAHNLKGLAVATRARPLRDLARSLEAALDAFDPDDEQRRHELLSAIDAARGLIAGAPGAEAAARNATVVLTELKPLKVRRIGAPWARLCLLRRVRPYFAALVDAVGEQLDSLAGGQGDHWRTRSELARELEVWSAALGLLGQPTLATLGFAIVSLLQPRQVPSPADVQLARDAWKLLAELREQAEAGLDQPVSPGLMAQLTELGAEGRRVDEARIPIAVELPWPDVDEPASLARAIERAASGRSILDARPTQPDALALRATLGLGPRRRSRREDPGYVPVPRRQLDHLLRLSEELVELRARVRAMDRLAHDLADAPPMEARLGLRRLAKDSAALDRELDHLARATQGAVLRARLVPLRGLYSLARVTVREYLARHPELQVDLKFEGAAVRLDKAVADGLVEPLLALLKNALEHGVETTAERRAAGKPERARIRLSAAATPAGVLLEVEDDGRGLDERRLVEAGRDRGLLLLRDEDRPALALAFAQGVSTADEISDDAGRGVGLMAVMEKVRALRGRLAYRSTPGRGTLARVSVPPVATTARVLLVRAGSERFALPMPSVLTVREAGMGTRSWRRSELPRSGPGSRSGPEPPAQPVDVDGAPVVRLADLVDPPLRQERRASAASAAIGVERRKRDRFTVMIAPPLSGSARGEAGALGCVVDDVLRRDLVVVRPLGRRFAPPGIDGAVIMGDGQLVLVVDVWRLHVAAQGARLRARGGGA